jgi:hypothetical protein
MGRQKISRERLCQILLEDVRQHGFNAVSEIRVYSVAGTVEGYANWSLAGFNPGQDDGERLSEAVREAVQRIQYRYDIEPPRNRSRG